LNVRSLRNKVDAVDDLMPSAGLDVLGVTESWHEDSSCVCIDRLRSLGYDIIETARPVPDGARSESIDFSKHGGVVILAKSGLRLTKLDSLGNYTTFEHVCVISRGEQFVMLLIS
jgi:hypothetical protein